MASRQTSTRGLKSVTGAILLALGFLVLFANLDAIAGQIVSAAGVSRGQATETLPAIGLAALHAAQAYAFEHPGFLPSLLQILVSCWPLILITLGAVLLRDAFRGRPAAYRSAPATSTRGDR